MGYGHVLLVREDAIKTLVKAEHAEVAAEVGRAVMKVCLEPDFIPDQEGRHRQTSVPVFNHANGIEWAGEFHSSQEELFVWARNSLAAARDTDTSTLLRIRDRLTQLLESRESEEQGE